MFHPTPHYTCEQTAKRKKASNTSTMLSKSDQKRFRYNTRLETKRDISNHYGSSFPAPKRRGDVNRKLSLTLWITSDSLRKRTYQASHPLPEVVTRSRFHHSFRVKSSHRQALDELWPGGTHRYRSQEIDSSLPLQLLWWDIICPSLQGEATLSVIGFQAF